MISRACLLGRRVAHNLEIHLRYPLDGDRGIPPVPPCHRDHDPRDQDPDSRMYSNCPPSFA